MILHHYIAPHQTSVLSRKTINTILLYSPYSPNLAPSDFQYSDNDNDVKSSVKICCSSSSQPFMNQIYVTYSKVDSNDWEQWKLHWGLVTYIEVLSFNLSYITCCYVKSLIYKSTCITVWLLLVDDVWMSRHLKLL